jgi:hypothetical protein
VILSETFERDVDVWLVGRTVFTDPTLFAESNIWDFSVDVWAFAISLEMIFTEATDLDDHVRCLSHHQLMYKLARGCRFTKKPEIPDSHWMVINCCWEQEWKRRPAFQALLDDFHTNHKYILTGADRSAVPEYEDQVYSYFGALATREGNCS